MNRQHARIGLVILSIFLLNTSSAVAETVDFEDLDPIWSDQVSVTPGYAGLNWVNFISFYVGPLNVAGDKTGYETGTSGAFAVFNHDGLPTEFSSDKPFTLVSAYLTAAWLEGMEITVDGYLGEKLVKTVTVTVSPAASQLFTFDFKGVNRVTLTPSGGTPLSGQSGGGTFFVMDNLEITSDDPEQTSITIDIKPGDSQNVINPKSKGVIPVAIFTTGSLSAMNIESSTALFGVDRIEAPALKAAIEDVDGDGRLDMLLFFATWQTDIECGDKAATLRVQTAGGAALEGTDSIRTVPCK